MPVELSNAVQIRPTPATSSKRDWAAGLIVAVLLLLGGEIRFADLRLSRGITDDERTYTVQALAIFREGVITGNRAVTQSYLQDPRLSLYHSPPTRIGFAAPVAGIMKLTGEIDESAGAFLSCAASIFALALTALIAFDAFGAWAAVTATALLAVFPADLITANRCWTDSLVGALELSMFYLTLQALGSRAPRAVYFVLLAGVGSAAMLVKETCILVSVPCLLAGIWVALFRKKSRRDLFLLLGTAAAGTVADLAIWSVCYGTFGTYIQMILAGMHSMKVNPYVLEWQTASPSAMLTAIGVLSPLTSSLAVLGVIMALLPLWFRSFEEETSQKREIMVIVAAGSCAFLSLYLFVPHWQNVRYASALFGPMCIFAGYAVQQTLRIAKRTAGAVLFGGLTVVCVIVVAGTLSSDYQRFRTYLSVGMQDLAVKSIFLASRQASHPR